jgi:hypothetical protein
MPEPAASKLAQAVLLDVAAAACDQVTAFAAEVSRYAAESVFHTMRGGDPEMAYGDWWGRAFTADVAASNFPVATPSSDVERHREVLASREVTTRGRRMFAG